jgi:hypothetical protein
MSKKDLYAIGLIYENRNNGNSTLKNENLFYALKAMLDDGDNFELLTNRTIDRDRQQTMSCQFIYKGTRYIRVFTGSFFPSENVTNLTVTIFEVTPEGKTIDKLDTNAFHNKGSHLDIGHDPTISSIEEFVSYIKSVLDREDRDPKNDDIEVPQRPITKGKKVSDFLSKIADMNKGEEYVDM